MSRPTIHAMLRRLAKQHGLTMPYLKSLWRARPWHSLFQPNKESEV